MKGFEIGNISIVAAIMNLWAVFTMLIAFIFMGQRLSPLQSCGVFMIISGATLASLNSELLTCLSIVKLLLRYLAGVPPAFHGFPAIDRTVGGHGAVCQSTAVGEDVLRTDRNDRAAVVTHDLLNLPVHCAAPVGVELSTGLDQQGVEALVLPVRIVPGGIGRVTDGGHQVHAGPTAPETGEERLLQPNIRPVAVIRLAHHLDLDAGLGSRLVE